MAADATAAEYFFLNQDSGVLILRKPIDSSAPQRFEVRFVITYRSTLLMSFISLSAV